MTNVRHLRISSGGRTRGRSKLIWRTRRSRVAAIVRPIGENMMVSNDQRSVDNSHILILLARHRAHGICRAIEVSLGVLGALVFGGSGWRDVGSTGHTIRDWRVTLSTSKAWNAESTRCRKCGWCAPTSACSSLRLASLHQAAAHEAQEDSKDKATHDSYDDDFGDLAESLLPSSTGM